MKTEKFRKYLLIHLRNQLWYENRTMKPVEIVLRRGRGDEGSESN
jgi:hypothetical protein